MIKSRIRITVEALSKLRLQKKQLTLPLLIIYLALDITPSNAATNATGSGTSKTTILTSIAITIVSGSTLNFGNASPGDTTKLIAATDATNAQRFTVTGQANTAFTITAPASISMTGPGAAIAVNSITTTPTAPNLGAGGSVVIGIGGTRAAIPNNQAAGNYTGTFSVTVSY